MESKEDATTALFTYKQAKHYFYIFLTCQHQLYTAKTTNLLYIFSLI